jgi:hypothetical protein
MWSQHWPSFLKAAPPRRRAAPQRLILERLEDRCVPSASPLPIPGQVFSALPGGNPFGGPTIHFGLPGPADNTIASLPRTIGGEPSTITNFNGFIGVAHVEGTGTDNHGNSYFWDVDLRLMDGVYRGDDGDVHQGTFAFV